MNNQINSPILFLKKYTVSKSSTIQSDSFDFIYVLSGEISLDTFHQTGVYSFGDICLLNPRQTYTLSSQNNNVILHMGITSKFFYEHLSEYYFLSCDSVLEPGRDYTQIKNLLASIAAKYAENSSQNALSICGLLLLLLDELKKNSHSLIDKDQLSHIPNKYHDRAMQIIEYINLHYYEPISLLTLADTLFLSPQYVSSFMKKYMNCSFKKTLNEKRLFHAEQDLRFTNLSITDIAIRNGFVNTNTFYKNFYVAYQQSPQEYRKTHSSTPALADTRAEFQTNTTADTAMLSQPQSIVVDMNESETIRKNICTIINIGKVHNLLFQKYQEALLFSCHRFGFRYIRMQELISNSFIPRVLPDYEYFFQNVNIVITFLYQNDLIPFVELSQHYEPFCSPLSVPDTTLRSERFFQLLENFLSYCATHWPADWLSQWKFELWFSPRDNFKKYASDIKRIKELLNQYLPGSSVGGPGFDYCFSTYTLEELLSSLSLQKVDLDFISIYLNYFTCDGDILQISTDKTILQKRCKDAKAIIQKYYPNLPLYATKWTSAYIPDLPISQSRFQATFICKSVLELQDICDLLGYWLFMDDFSAKTKDTANYDYWSQGLFSTNFIKSPAFYAFDMITRKGNKIICRGSNYLITQKSQGHYQAIAFNYAHFNAFHTGITEQNYSFENIYDIFEETPDININIKLCGMPSGFYRITRHLLDSYHGSYLDILIGEYMHSNIERSEFLQYAWEPFDIQNSYCLEACIPEERIIYISVENTLTFPSIIPVHCICTWDIQELRSEHYDRW